MVQSGRRLAALRHHASWAKAETATRQAQTKHDQDAAQAAASGQPAPPFTDPGAATRQAVRETLNRPADNSAKSAMRSPVPSGTRPKECPRVRAGSMTSEPSLPTPAVTCSTAPRPYSTPSSIAKNAAGNDYVSPMEANQSGTGGGAAEPPFEPPKGISGKIEHGETQMAGRDRYGVNDAAAHDAVDNPVKAPQYKIDQYGGTYRFTGKDAIVNPNEKGEVVTAWARSRAGWRTE
jgi:hypothetical protein